MSDSTFSLPEGCCALILAAGKGTRMHTRKPKVLHTILGEPLLGHVVGTLRTLFDDAIWTVIGHEAEMIRTAFAKQPMRFIEQTEQRGTGHALMVALPVLRAAGMKRVLVVNGDTPLITRATLERFVNETNGADVAVATLTLPSPEAYGRIVRRNGDLAAIVEAKDFDSAVHGPEPREINAGIYMLDTEVAHRLLPRLQPSAVSGEIYITDLISFAVQDKLTVRGIDCGDDPTLLGINNPAELARSEELLRTAIVQKHLDACVVLHTPQSLHIGPFVRIEPGAELFGPCEVYGHTVITADAVIESHCRITDATIAAGAHIRSFSHIEDARVGSGCLVGPYARLRPGAVMEPTSHVGNFVEMKNAHLGVGAKANHLTYLGDADIGAHSNVGAGTITCNYDGVHKHKTIIGEHAFIGSNTSLVAPVTVGAESVIGAGSVITKTVPDNTLAVARGRQTNLARRK